MSTICLANTKQYFSKTVFRRGRYTSLTFWCEEPCLRMGESSGRFSVEFTRRPEHITRLSAIKRIRARCVKYFFYCFCPCGFPPAYRCQVRAKSPKAQPCHRWQRFPLHGLVAPVLRVIALQASGSVPVSKQWRCGIVRVPAKR